jgi:spore germination protein D
MTQASKAVYLPEGSLLRMRNRFISLLALSGLLFTLTSCGSDSSGGGGNQMISYKDMKSMVIDILKTEDAQKALQDSSAHSASTGGLQALSLQGQEQVKLAVKDVLVSPDYNKVIEKLMTDPKFAGEFAKAVNKQNKQIHKDLMKDPMYQKDLIQVMKDPEMSKMITDAMQSQQHRKQIVTIMQESMQSPIIRLELLELLQKAVHEELSKGTEQSGGGSGGSGGSSGGSGGDGGGG